MLVASKSNLQLIIRLLSLDNNLNLYLCGNNIFAISQHYKLCITLDGEPQTSKNFVINKDILSKVKKSLNQDYQLTVKDTSIEFSNGKSKIEISVSEYTGEISIPTRRGEQYVFEPILKAINRTDNALETSIEVKDGVIQAYQFAELKYVLYESKIENVEDFAIKLSPLFIKIVKAVAVNNDYFVVKDHKLYIYGELCTFIIDVFIADKVKVTNLTPTHTITISKADFFKGLDDNSYLVHEDFENCLIININPKTIVLKSTLGNYLKTQNEVTHESSNIKDITIKWSKILVLWARGILSKFQNNKLTIETNDKIIKLFIQEEDYSMTIISPLLLY